MRNFLIILATLLVVIVLIFLRPTEEGPEAREDKVATPHTSEQAGVVVRELPSLVERNAARDEHRRKSLAASHAPHCNCGEH